MWHRVKRRINKEVMPMTFIAKILKKIFAIHSPSKEWMNAYNEDSPKKKNINHISAQFLVMVIL